MIPVPPGVRVLIATRPVDFREGAASLAALAKETLAQDPFCGAVRGDSCLLGIIDAAEELSRVEDPKCRKPSTDFARISDVASSPPLFFGGAGAGLNAPTQARR